MSDAFNTNPGPPMGLAPVTPNPPHPAFRSSFPPPGLRTPKGPTDVAALFMLLAAVVAIFPLLARQKLDHCPNDASRWNTVFFLVEDGSYAYNNDWEKDGGLPWMGGKGKTEAQLAEMGVDKEKTIQVGEMYYPGPFDLWGIGPFWSIDMIKVGDKYYSSKPPILATCVAGVVWVIYQVTPALAKVAPSLIEDGGWTFASHPYAVMRTTVIIVQVIPFLIAIWLIARYVRRQTDSPYVRNFCIGAAALGTYLTPYLIPLNNHVIAACTATFAVYAALRIWYDKQRQWYLFVIAGFFAAFTAAIETPAVIFAGLLFLVLLFKSPGKTITLGLIAGLIPAAAAVYTNYRVMGNWEDALKPIPTRFEEEGGPYFYPGSYWHENAFWGGPTGIDAQDEPKDVYLAHLLIGHHGFFLLTPIFLISLLGIFAHWFRRDERARPLLALLVLLISAAVVAIYTKRTGNYGGGCQGARWLFWLIPLWLMMLPAGVRILSRARLGRALCILLMGVSLVSVYWALPQVDGTNGQPPFSTSWAHDLFGELPWESLRIDY